MPQAFTPKEMETIRRLLFDSACRHAVLEGAKKTSLELLAADAGISKSTFYKFYDCKEALFMEVGQHFEYAILAETERVLKQNKGKDSKSRLAEAVAASFAKVTEMGVLRFLREDMPQIVQIIAPNDAMDHLKTIAENIIRLVKHEGIRFTIPETVVSSIIRILYLSIQHVQELEHFTEALSEVVLGVCNRIVE